MALLKRRLAPTSAPRSDDLKVEHLRHDSERVRREVEDTSAYVRAQLAAMPPQPRPRK